MATKSASPAAPAPASTGLPTPVIVSERPTIKRVRVNPFSEHFPIDEGAKVWTFPSKTDADKKALQRAQSQMRDAAKKCDRTARINLSDGPTPGTTNVTVWTIPKITHKKK